MTDDLTFQSLGRRRPGRRSPCPICGQSTAGSVHVNLMARNAGKPKLVTSVSKVACERHLVELYRRIEEVWAEFFAHTGPSAPVGDDE